MKKLILFLLLATTMSVFGQVDAVAPKYDLTRPNPKTTAQIQSMTRMQEGSEAWNTETKTIWRYDGTTWGDTEVALTAAEIETLLDIYYGGQTWREDAKTRIDTEYPNLDVDGTDDVNLTGNQSIGGAKTFTGSNSYFDGRLNLLPTAANVFNTGYGSVSMDGSYNLRVVGNGLASTYILDGSNITAQRTITWPDKSGTPAFLDDIASGTSGLSLPAHVLDTIYASATPSTAYLTDARFENSLNTTLGSGLGQRKVIISSDATYNHDIGTVLWFQSGGETSMIISPDTGVSGFSEFTHLGNAALIKRASNIWNVLINPESTTTYTMADITYDNSTSGLVGDTGQEAVDELAAASIPLSSINKNADYTVTGTEENRIIAANPALNDSIGFTTNDGVFTGPGFFTILNKGEGKIYLKQGTIPYQNGDWETPAGPGYKINARIEHQDSIYVDPRGLVAHTEAAAPIYDGQNAAGPDDVNATTGWSINSGDATITVNSTDASAGIYAIQVDKTVGTGTVYVDIDLTSYLSYNTNYTITLDTKKTAQSFNYRYFLDGSQGWTTAVDGTLLTGTTPSTYTQESLSGTTAASGTILLRIVCTSTTPINAQFLTDNIVITETP